jgi:hypothetical protein
MGEKQGVNRMAEIAAMYGKSLGECFRMRIGACEIECAFTKWGLVEFYWHNNPPRYRNLLQDLATGEAVIVDEEQRTAH